MYRKELSLGTCIFFLFVLLPLYGSAPWDSCALPIPRFSQCINPYVFKVRLRGGEGEPRVEEWQDYESESENDKYFQPLGLRLEQMSQESLSRIDGQMADMGNLSHASSQSKEQSSETKPSIRRVTAEVMEAMHSFAWIPLCPQSMEAFIMQVPFKDLVELLKLPADQVECDHEESVFVVALRCLHKLCSSAKTTEVIEKILRTLGVPLNSVAPALSNCMRSADTETKSGAVSLLGLFSDERGGAFIQETGLAADAVRLLGCESSEVANTASNALNSIIRSDSGLAAVFSGDSLQLLDGWLQQGLQGVGLRVANLLISMSSQKPECKECCEALGVRQVVERGIDTDDAVIALNAIELAHMLPIQSVSASVVFKMLSDAVSAWQDRQIEEENEDILAMDLLHEHRMHAVAAYLSLSSPDALPASVVLELFTHVQDLLRRQESAPQRLGITTLTVLSRTPVGGRLWAQSEVFRESLEFVEAGIRSTTHDLSIACIDLLTNMVALVGKHTEEAKSEEILPIHLVKLVVAEAWGRLRRLSSVPFHPQRMAALHAVRQLAQHAWAVEIMFVDKEFALSLMIRKDGFMYAEDAEAQEERWEILRAASQTGVLQNVLGKEMFGDVLDSLSVGPLQPWYGGARRRPIAVPKVATMYMTA